MSGSNFIQALIIGIIMGGLARVLLVGNGLGLVVDIALSIFGSLLGSWLVFQLGFSFLGFWGYTVTSLVLALILLYISRLISR